MELYFSSEIYYKGVKRTLESTFGLKEHPQGGSRLGGEACSLEMGFRPH